MYISVKALTLHIYFSYATLAISIPTRTRVSVLLSEFVRISSSNSTPAALGKTTMVVDPPYCKSAKSKSL